MYTLCFCLNPHSLMMIHSMALIDSESSFNDALAKAAGCVCMLYVSNSMYCDDQYESVVWVWRAMHFSGISEPCMTLP